MEIKNTIGQINPYQAQLDRAQHPGEKGKAAKSGDTAESARKGDTVTLSSGAKLRAEADAAAASAPDIRQDKIDAIKARIEAGEYSVDSRRIASRLLAEEPGLFR